MKGILRRKLAVRTLPPLPFQQPHLSPPPTRAEDISVAKRPRPDTPISTAENEVLEAPTADTATTAPLSSWVVVASSSSATGDPLAHRREWEPVEADEEPTETRRRTGKKWSAKEDAKLIAAVKKYGKNWVAVASMVPGRTNVRCRAHYIWVMGLHCSLSEPIAHAGKWTTEEDAELPNVGAVAAPTAATMTSASSIDTEVASRTDTATLTAPLIRMEGSRVVPPQQLQQDEDIPDAKRPRFETSLSISAEVEVLYLSLAETAATVSSIDKIAAVHTDTATVTAPLTCMESSRIAPPQQLQQDEGIPAAKRPRFETSRHISVEVEVIDLSMEDTVTTASSNHKAAAARTYSAMVVAPLLPCVGGPRASTRNNTARTNTAAMAPLLSCMRGSRESGRTTRVVLYHGHRF
jgi:hypothetical protein